MSAIAGIYYLDGQPVERTNLERMVESLAHRGSDASGIWSEGSIGLAHRMLWTTPESLQEQLPLKNYTSDLVITADARIDNRDELIAALGLTNRPAEIADSQLILASYEKWGDRCPEKLLGDFAFAIWDQRQQKLFCARDPMGVKPFYYYRSNRVFVLASEIKALLCLAEVPRQLNEVRVAYHLALLFEDQEITFYKDILRLPPAHSITVGSQQQLRLYWSLDPLREVRLHSDQEYAQAFQEIFTEAVRCRLRSAFPVGSTLSGGLDSSSIASTARKLLLESGTQHLHTFSAIFPNLPKEDLRWIDERRYINAVLAEGGFESHSVHADCLSPLIELLWQDDEAVPAPNLYMHQALYSAAQQQGVRIFLDGLDGDSTVSHGWGYLTELTYTGRWQTLFAELRAIARRYKLPRRRLLWKYSITPLLVEAARRSQLWRGTQNACSKTLNPTFAQRIKLAERTQTLLSDRSTPTCTARQEHWRNLTSGLHAYGLELTDKGAAKFSLEARYPFYDQRLIEFCLALPPEQKLHQGWTRLILRRAMTDILPPEVQWRVHKANLGPNFKRRLLEYERETLERVINKPQIIEPFVDVQALSAAYEHYASQPLQSNQDAIAVFAAVTLALWLDQVRLIS